MPLAEFRLWMIALTCGAVAIVSFVVVWRAAKTLRLSFPIPEQRHSASLLVVDGAEGHLAAKQEGDRLVWNGARRDWHSK